MLSSRFGRLPVLLLATAVAACVPATAKAGARVVVYPQARTAYVGGYAPRCGLGYAGRAYYGYAGRYFPSYGYAGRYIGGYGGHCLSAYGYAGGYLSAYGYAGRYVSAYGYIGGGYPYGRPSSYGYGLAPYVPYNSVYLYSRDANLVRPGIAGIVGGSLVAIP